MSTESMPGPLTRAKNFVLKVVFILVGYTISMAVLMALRGPIVASSGEGSFTVIFGAWVIGTLALLGFLT
jgi:hypothetical protein